MPQFRKKPVIIEARYYDGSWESARPLLEWVGKAASWGSGPGLIIKTLEGTHFASPGDWVIRGVQGEFYSCKPDIFVETYEEISP